MTSQLKLALASNKKLSEQLKVNKRFTEMLYREHEQAKKKISAELHDEIAQILTAINFDLAIISKQEKIPEKLKNTQLLIEESVKIINQFARELRPTILDDLGLIPALKSHFSIFSQKNSIELTLTTSSEFSELNDLHKIILFRITEESLNNIAKHSKATRVSISLKQRQQFLILEIQDNGVGFNLAKKKKFGIFGMEERLKLAQGKLIIKSVLTKGTLIKAQIKL